MFIGPFNQESEFFNAINKQFFFFNLRKHLKNPGNYLKARLFRCEHIYMKKSIQVLATKQPEGINKVLQIK
jgi:hypothetical protein